MIFLYEFLTTWVFHIRSECWKPPFQSLRLFCSERGKKTWGRKSTAKKLYVTSIFEYFLQLPVGNLQVARCWNPEPKPRAFLVHASQGEGTRAHQETDGSSRQILDPGWGWVRLRWPADGQLDEILVAQAEVAHKFESFMIYESIF